jgi:AraC family transcriptional regulator of adaptative response/methylated-DNA-[protein]-cysteine methyltransferase
VTDSRIDPGEAWAAVEQRDARFDGVLFCGVTSTGVYCRPSCPSRRPKPENVRFFASTAEAESAGFRACLRCRPKEPARPQALVERVRALLDESPDGAPSLSSLGEALQVSPAHLQRTFKRVTGLTPREYVQASRRSAIRQQLRNGEGVASATYEAGFGSSSRVYEGADALFGMTPGRYQRGGLGVSVVYGLTDCALGKLLLAATGRGVCFVAMGDSEEALESELRAELPRAELSRDEVSLSAYLDAAAAFFEGAPAVQPPLDLRGSEFQLLVWKFLKTISPGRTATYQEVARAIGRPGAARAVARACAANPAPLFVPCHRVVRSDGLTGGYRWGAERKRELLAREKEQAGD